MASEVERLSDALRVFGNDAHRLSRDLEASFNETRQIVRQAAELRVDGVDARKVVEALTHAQDQLARAIEHTGNLAVRAGSFADHLAGR